MADKYPYDYIPKRAILYCRISDADTTHGVDDQNRRLREFVTALKWGILAVLIENDTSAFKRRKVLLPDGSEAMRVVRPEFRKGLGWLKSGTADGFAALDLDRALRDPRDLEDMIDIVEDRRIPVRSITGSLRLDTDADVTMARVMTAIANKSSRDTSRRVAAHREARALAGVWSGGPRAFGWEPDGVTLRPSEAQWIERWAYELLQGVDLSEMARDANGNVPTVTGAKWTTPTINKILRRPAIAGRMVYRGEDIGEAPWEPIIPHEVWESVVETLSDDSRRTTPGPTPKYLGSGIYLCGKCRDGTPMKIVSKASKRAGPHRQTYRCRDVAHLSRTQAYLDQYVEEVIIARLSRRDARDLIRTPNADVDVEALRKRATVLRGNIKSLARDRALGEITRSEHLEGARVAKAELSRIDEVLQIEMVDSPLTPFIEAEDVAAEWDRSPLGVKRAVLRCLMTVTVLPARGLSPGDGFFNSDGVEIRWVDDADEGV